MTHPNLTDESLRAAVNQAPMHSQLGECSPGELENLEMSRFCFWFERLMCLLFRELLLLNGIIITVRNPLLRLIFRRFRRKKHGPLAERPRLLVFEDIDAIFGKDREKLLSDSVLTFSGGQSLGGWTLFWENEW